VFVICLWPASAAAPTCKTVAPTGERVVGEAGVYRVEDD
jgi:hypothetical protein